MKPTFASTCLLAAWLCVATGATQAQPAQPPLPLVEMQRLAAAFSLLRDGFATPVSGEALMAAALRGMVRDTDPEGGEYYSEDDMKHFRQGPDASVGDVGAQVLVRDGRVLLLPTQGGPSDAAGVRPRDTLLAIDGQAVTGLSDQYITRLLKAAPGSRARLTLLRGLSPTPLVVDVTRAVPVVARPTAQRAAGGTLVLKVPAFQDRTLNEVGDLVRREWQQPFTRLVLDLRRNPGGLLDGVIGLAALFLPATAVVAKTVGRLPESNQTLLAQPSNFVRLGGRDPWVGLPPELRAMPLVVLVDEGTASGAELVVMALQDQRQARVLGRPTFGRGSIQTVRMLPGGGALKYTTAFWESPSGRRLTPQGVQPDQLLDTADAEQELAAAVAAAAALPMAAASARP
jgi:carboxyl-terminal processing protease